MQLLTREDNGGEVKSKGLSIEKVAESSSPPLEAVSSILGPYPIPTDKPLCPVNIHRMQLVPFIKSNSIDQTTRGSRAAESPTPYGKGPVISYLDALTRNLKLPKQNISPLKVNTLLPLISNYIPHDTSHNTQNSLGIVPHHKQQSTPKSPNDLVHVCILPAIPEINTNIDDKPKRKQRSIEKILGIPKSAKSKKGGRKSKQRNRILLSESKAAWSVTKILGIDYMGNDEEVLSRIMVTDEEAELSWIVLFRHIGAMWAGQDLRNLVASFSEKIDARSDMFSMEVLLGWLWAWIFDVWAICSWVSIW
ncbi:hypothetical protein Acr_07g0007610 [Actinidia rufa]|uniref:Uncharacterized protein n=1 Tax=Actinidia rufa TaxID=165716 RepID=A0A7J0EVS7_9ERIC|nr:hypothetical protein Acr_07g0007610 [Actinidia rufa]